MRSKNPAQLQNRTEFGAAIFSARKIYGLLFGGAVQISTLKIKL